MSEMVERVAAAIRDHRSDEPHADRKRACRELARAAIAAMREPTEVMYIYAYVNDSTAMATWTEMIDAALMD